MKFILAIGKQLFDLCGTDAARLRIGGVEPEVVREDHAPGLSRRGGWTSEHAQHVGADISSKIRIENGGYCSGLQDQVKGLRWKRQGLSVGIGKARTRKCVMRMEQAVKKQIHAMQFFRKRAEPQIFGQYTPAAAAHF